mgnify:CR=1 FL=1
MLSDHDRYITNEPTQRAKWCILCGTPQDCWTEVDGQIVCSDCDDIESELYEKGLLDMEDEGDEWEDEGDE